MKSHQILTPQVKLNDHAKQINHKKINIVLILWQDRSVNEKKAGRLKESPADWHESYT